MTVAEVASTSSTSSNSDDSVARYGFFRRGDQKPDEERVPFNRPTVRQVYDALPFVRRYSLYWLKHIGKREKLFINTFQPLKHKPHYGVPCGTIGSGSIGRDFRGGFCKFGLRPGMIEHKVNVLRADQFIVTVRHNSTTIYQKVLSAAAFTPQAASELSAWDFSFPAEDLHYRGLFPRSWTTYQIADCGLTIVCRQISPVIPNDYQESSLPTSVFVFEVENSSDRQLDISISFAFRNGTGYKRWKAEGSCTSKSFHTEDVIGVCLDHTISDMKCTYALSARRSEGSQVTVCESFDPSGSGERIWNQLKLHGQLQGSADSPLPNELGVAICVQSTVEARSSLPNPIEFALVWHMPIVEFGAKKRHFQRRYTRFYGVDADVSKKIAHHSLNSYEAWERRIDDWQTPLLSHPQLPDWYKSAIFNELYYIVDGGTVWFEFDDSWKTEERQLSDYSSDLLKEFGRFGYLESWEYRMLNTYDVHFYASFALAELWPALQHVIQAEITDHVEHYDEKTIRFHMEGDKAPQKTRLRVPHDLGNPAQDPWLVTNAYVMHDTGKWKDLNLKFVLTTYRDYAVLRSDQKDRKKFLEFAWPVVKSLIEDGLRSWDKDGDGMIENFGAADQTYDAWRMNGVSAYCGSLWLAALRVTVEMARDMGESEVATQYTETLEKAKAVYVARLWNGEYFNFDEHSKSKNSIMADQLCGYWFLESINPEMAAEIIDPDKVRKALDKIYNFNVKKFVSGRMGAVNGMNPSGKVDRNYIQADEMWTGISYALASFFVQQGEVQRGFDTAWGPYDACYNRFGLQYQTPEALYERKYYRAIGYMRPLSIWAIQWSLRRFCQLGNSESPFLKDVSLDDPDVRSIGRQTEGISDEDEGIVCVSADDEAGAISSNESVCDAN